MDARFDPDDILDAHALEVLQVRSDRPSAVRLALHGALLIASFAALAILPPASPWLVVAVPAFGFLLFSIYAPFHECTHRTAFASRRANAVGAWLTGLTYGYSPGVHACFHFTHHRLTNLDGDPEKGFSLPGHLPLRTPLQISVAGVLGMLVPLHSVLLSITPVGWWDRIEASWIPAKKRPRLAWESRVVAAAWVVGLAVVWPHTQLLLASLAGLFVARFIHGCVTVSEHEGLPDTGHMADRTRSMRTNPVFQWFWWNMNFHAEHHVWPAIPWHQLPAAHARAGEGIPRVEDGYVRFFVTRRYRPGVPPRP